jgi:hypothetical protein
MALQLDSRLKASFEHDVAQREEVSDSDIHFSRLSGLAPHDVDVLCDFTREQGLLLVIRCPKRPARYFQGKVAPKPLGVKQKSDPATGLVKTADGTVHVSDYDLMSVWRFLGNKHYEKIFFSAADHRHPHILPPLAQSLLDQINPRLKSPFQHGAQDDFHSPKNPNIRLKTEGADMQDRFIAFNLGAARYLCNGAELKTLYDRLLGKEAWPYDEHGRHRAARA